MVGLVLVSHSKRLADAVRELVLQMTAPDFPVAVASGVGEHHEELGTDAVHISEVLAGMAGATAILVLMDLGSAVLSAQTALELLDPSLVDRIRLCPAPLVEGAIAAAVQAAAGAGLEEVFREAQRGLAAKQEQLKPEAPRIVLPTAISSASSSRETAELVLVINNEHGLHARPAAALVQTVSKFASTVKVLNMTSGRGPAPGRSLTSLALLQVRKGDRIRVFVSGPDRDAALRAIDNLAKSGFGESIQFVAEVKAPPPAMAKPPRKVGGGGTPASDGIAIGPLVSFRTSSMVSDDVPTGTPAVELAKLDAAVKEVGQQLLPQGSAKGKRKIPAAVEILEAQSFILSDPVLMERVRDQIEVKHVSAGIAWMEATEEIAAQYESINDTYLRERAADIRDIARRVLWNLRGNESVASIVLDPPAILITHELLPSEAAACDPATVLGVITHQGSATSHSAIILRTLGIPMIVGATWIDEESCLGKTVAMDGETGGVWIEPAKEVLDSLRARQEEQLEKQQQVAILRAAPSVTLDGTRIEVLANVGSSADAQAAAANGAEGVGLLRTEFLFLSRTDAPSEDEQVVALREIFAPLTEPIVVRTLDVGADKPLPYLSCAEEHNPYLGVRGIRLSLKSPELFLAHLRAILRAGVGHDLWLMFPMISTLEEVRQAREFLGRAHDDLTKAKQHHVWPLKVGIMIEVPSAAIMSEQLAEEVDFFSIGTNDLTQYVMAAERGNAEVAALQDAMHPAVLRLIDRIVAGARKRGRHVSLCGDAASDPVGAAILIGMGVQSLSVRPRQVAEIKALFRTLARKDLEQLADNALAACEAADVRKLVTEYLSASRRPGNVLEMQPTSSHQV